MTEPLISIRHLNKTYKTGKRSTEAICDLSLTLYKGETMGLVGESGSGKTTVGKCLLRLEEADAGTIHYENRSLFDFDDKELFAFRREAQFIFQDPYSSLNPRMTAEEIVAEPLRIHNVMSSEEIPPYVADLFTRVGLSPLQRRRFPHEFSGGQRQRLGIARALALKPQFIVCDEPISALDVPIQAQIINLLKILQHKLGLTYLFITHNLAVARYIADRIAVLYQGHLVESSLAEELYRHPLHPYTQALLAAIPSLLPGKSSPSQKDPSLYSPSEKGCPFAPRCPKATPLCHECSPPFSSPTQDHLVACHHL